MKRYRCKECGYIHIGDEVPEVCPVCAYDSTVFEEMEEISNQRSRVEFYDMIDTDDINLIKNFRNAFDSCSSMSAISRAMSFQARHENLVNEADNLEKLSDELNKQATIYAMFLGEFLEFSTAANIGDLKKKIGKLILKNNDILECLSSEYPEYIEIIKNNNVKLGEILD